MIETNAGIASVVSVSPTVASDLERLRETSGKIVGSVFFGTLLKAMRESNLKGAYGHGGRGEEVFAEQLHGILAQRMGEASGNGVGEAIHRALQQQQTRISTNRAATGGSNR